MMPRADERTRLPFSELTRSPRVLHVLHSLLRIGPPALRLGLPQRYGTCTTSRPGGIFVLETSLGAGPVLLLLDTASVVAIADRMLGGDGAISLTPRADLPQPAELGCVGYALARILSALESPYQLRDARCSAAWPPLPDALSWPMCLHTELGKLPFVLVAHPGLVPAEPMQAALCIDDPLAPALPLSPGDLVLTDAPLTRLSDGLAGPLVLRLPDLDTEALVDLCCGRLALKAQRPAAHDDTGLVLEERALCPAELCALGAGTLAWPIDGQHPVRLRVRGQDLASGELIRARGAIGMRVHSVTGPGLHRD
jgi:hypothetical protein